MATTITIASASFLGACSLLQSFKAYRRENQELQNRLHIQRWHLEEGQHRRKREKSSDDNVNDRSQQTDDRRSNVNTQNDNRKSNVMRNDSEEPSSSPWMAVSSVGATCLAFGGFTTFLHHFFEPKSTANLRRGNFLKFGRVWFQRGIIGAVTCTVFLLAHRNNVRLLDNQWSLMNQQQLTTSSKLHVSTELSLFPTATSRSLMAAEKSGNDNQSKSI